MVKDVIHLGTLMSSFCTESHQYLRCYMGVSEVLALTPCGNDELLAYLSL
jgi:hypothetical protein